MQDYIINKVKEGLPEWVITLLRGEGCYIAGGALTSVATNKEINDYDVYFPSKEALSNVLETFAEEDPHCSFLSDKSITYHVKNGTGVPVALQFIYYDFYKTARSIFKHFDFTINMCVLDLGKDKLVMDKNFLLHNSQRYLDFNPKTKFPMISALRIQKYKERGYKISRSQYMKILMAVNKLKLKSWEDFSCAVGNPYGLNFVKQEEMTGKFSLDKAFDIIENTDFDGHSIQEYKYSPQDVHLVLRDTPVKYAELENGDIVTEVDSENIYDLISEGKIKSEKASIKEVLGDKLYKVVTSNLNSIHYNSFKYVLGEECKAQSLGWRDTKNPVLYFCIKEDLKTHSFFQGNLKNRLILEVDYKEEDVTHKGYSEVQIKKCTPVRVLQPQEFLTEVLGEQEETVKSFTDDVPW